MRTNYFDHLQSYVSRDFETPKHSTLAFSDFLSKHNLYSTTSSETILDLGCGGGSGLHYLAKSAPNVSFTGIDYNSQLVDWVNSIFFANNPKYKLDNMQIICKDWSEPQSILDAISPKNVKGVISVHSLCTQKSFKEAASCILDLGPDWIAFNSLFYDGPLDVLIHIRDHTSSLEDQNPDADFNIHSLHSASQIMQSHGYHLASCETFDIGIHLPPPTDGARGTYTIKTEWSDYTQFSGPVHLPWHFVLFQR
jgi:hypothetical protein